MMKEDDYVLATNLAKIRIVNHVLRSIYFDKSNEELKTIISKLQRQEDKLYKELDKEFNC